jgi:carbon monoxide dehydrogenase subunit G
LETAGEIHVAAAPDAVFAFVNNPFTLAPCIPGCSNVRDLGGGRYGATMSGKAGFIPIKVDIVVELTKIEPPTALDATIAGSGPSPVTASARMRFEPDATGTTIRYTINVELSGALAALGGGMLAKKSDGLGRRFGANLKAAADAALA